MGGFAWVTLATNDSYSLGALVLAHSLRRVGTPHDLVVLITPGVSQSMRDKLASIFTQVQEVNVLDSKDDTNLAVLNRPELGITFTKLHCWKLTQYEKCVFLDADVLVIKNSDELFERDELSAAPDVGWPDCFNSGVFVYAPSDARFADLVAFANSHGSFDGADQGLLNLYFHDWAHKDIAKHLPFIYNMCSVAMYSYAPAYRQYGENVKIVHFIGNTKPWLQHYDTATGIVQPPPGCAHLQPLIQTWWNIFCDNVHSQLSDNMGGIAGALSKMTLDEVRTEEQSSVDEGMRKFNWEQGQIDYMGADSFDNIMKKIHQTIAAGEPSESTEKKTQKHEKSTESGQMEAAVEATNVTRPEIPEGNLSNPAQVVSIIDTERISLGQGALVQDFEPVKEKDSPNESERKVDTQIGSQENVAPATDALSSTSVVRVEQESAQSESQILVVCPRPQETEIINRSEITLNISDVESSPIDLTTSIPAQVDSETTLDVEKRISDPMIESRSINACSVESSNLPSQADPDEAPIPPKRKAKNSKEAAGNTDPAT
ncbi:glycogenin-1 isoform X1 [Trichogramma pretiosum]|uniref:glycogenin-1 isoform X1 n=1 Tax=Trichogramma pretiosum TaxID=7493 RepID=UPI0006C9AC8E|nr:glycogenin-1 isoform X1 [Trichogramma pretiosum]